MSAYQLYWRAGSGSMVVEAALRMIGVDYMLIDAPSKAEQQSAHFLAINPAGKIPVLITPHGQTIFESMAILLVLDEQHKAAGILPDYGTAARATTLQWLSFLVASTFPAALRFYYPHRFTIDTFADAIECVKAAGGTAMDADFALLSAALKGPFVLGKTLTITDVYLAMIADWHEPAMEIPAIQKLKTAMLENQAIKAAWENHKFTL